MKFLFKNITLADPESPENGQKLDLFIRNGKIEEPEATVSDDTEIIELDGLCVSPGWFDMHAEITDPGFEFKEDTVSMAAAAAAGGFTDLLCFPNTQPVLQHKQALLSLQEQTRALAVTFHGVPAATANAEGKDLTEMLDLYKHGARAFSDGEHGIQQADVVLKALQYLQITDALLVNRAEHTRLNEKGQMHEGMASTRLGLKGMPALAEELHLTRDLELLNFAGGRLHVPFISTAVSVQKIREAKAKGLNVTCGVATYQLAFTDEEIIPFDTNYKVNPPFRLAQDRQALIEGLLDGTIDVLVSGHKPQDPESKNLEFDHASFGMINLETAFAVLRTYAPELSLEVILSKLVYNPRRILGVPVPKIKKGEEAVLTFFHPDQTWTYEETEAKSKSRNSPFFGKELRGRVFGIANKGKLVIQDKVKA